MAVLRSFGCLAIAFGVGLSGGAAGCGGDAATTGSGGSGGSGAGGQGPSTTAPSSSSAGGSGGSAGAGGGGGTGGAWVPTPADTNYQAVDPLPAGEIIVFNDWNSTPSTLNAIPAAGGQKTTVFESLLVWDFGVAPTSRRIAFSSGFSADVQKEHYGTDVGDAIMPTWIYDPTTHDASLLAYGNINDECHVFGPGEKTLYLCRRYDFDALGTSKGYRVGSIAMKNGAFTFLTDDIPMELDFHPAVNADETTLLFGAVLIKDGKQSREIKVEGLPPTTPTVLRTDADAPVFSADYTRFVYTDYADKGALYAANANGSSPVKLATEGGDSAVWSPDGSHVAFLAQDDANNCAHIDVVKADGSEADAPVRFRDCAKSGEFITGLGWLGP